MDQRKPAFWHISRHVLLNIFSHNLDLRKNINFVSAKIIRSLIYELSNCAKIKGALNKKHAKFYGIKVCVLQLFASQVVTS